MTCPLNDITDPVLSPAAVMDMIRRMINNNISIIFVLVLVILFLLASLYYFGSSLLNTLKNYYINRGGPQKDASVSNSLKSKIADDEVYQEPNDPNDAEPEPEPKTKVDPKTYMPRTKKDFLANLAIENAKYNEDKTLLLTRRMNYPENDDIVDDKILYKDYDNYKYDYTTE